MDQHYHIFRFWLFCKSLPVWYYLELHDPAIVWNENDVLFVLVFSEIKRIYFINSGFQSFRQFTGLFIVIRYGKFSTCQTITCSLQSPSSMFRMLSSFFLPFPYFTSALYWIVWKTSDQYSIDSKLTPDTIWIYILIQVIYHCYERKLLNKLMSNPVNHSTYICILTRKNICIMLIYCKNSCN